MPRPTKETEMGKAMPLTFTVPLNEKEQIVHELAAAMLKTRYDPQKCNRAKLKN